MPKGDNNCATFTLDTITTTNSSLGYNIKAYTKTSDTGITIKKQDNTELPTNPNDPIEIINTTTITTNDKKATAYQACADSSISDGTKTVEVAYMIAENPTPCVSDQQFKGDVGNMQNIDTSTWDQGDTGIAVDTRNDQKYCIGKLKDEKTWMLDNLKLALTDGMILTSTTTDVTSNRTVTFSWNNFIQGDAGHDDNFVTSGYLTRNGDDSTTGANYNAWRQVNPSDPNMPNSANCRINDGSTYNSSSKTGCGYLYNFYTATANTTSNGSICPAGWKLPSGENTSGDFGMLDLAYQPGGTGSIHGLSDPDTQMLWLPAGAWRNAFSGYYDSGLNNQGSTGNYLSSSIYSVFDTYVADFDSNGVNPGVAYGRRSGGFAIRCLIG
ncbi:MAG: fibrobacter succinogenes major paralogous domain-containing protein [Candidatus Nomurabacteria bacterium]|nr:fibrobacter succinogenes major paralogous domain-containing protein [Candidatus Nomurabacteria bacterium]